MSPAQQEAVRQAWEERDAERARECHWAGRGFVLVAALAAVAHDPLTNTGRPRWLVICSCGWERATVSEWAARSASKLHPQLAPMDVVHVTRVDGPDDIADGQQLTLT
jgi:hypothetical protein